MGFLLENSNGHCARNIDKWVALGMMQRVEQVRNIAEMLSAAMEDLSDQMTNLESNLECLTDATDTIQEQIEEMMNLIQEEISTAPDAVNRIAESGNTALSF